MFPQHYEPHGLCEHNLCFHFVTTGQLCQPLERMPTPAPHLKLRAELRVLVGVDLQDLHRVAQLLRYLSEQRLTRLQATA